MSFRRHSTGGRKQRRLGTSRSVVSKSGIQNVNNGWQTYSYLDRAIQARGFYATLRNLELLDHSPGSHVLISFRYTSHKTFTELTHSQTCKYNDVQFHACEWKIYPHFSPIGK